VYHNTAKLKLQGGKVMNHFDEVVMSIVPTKIELNKLNRVRLGQESDAKKSPFSADKWYMQFTKLNADGISLVDAPINTLLMVVTESLGTLYKNDRGTSIMRGSILVKLSDNILYCTDGSSWYASPSSGALVYGVKGYLEFAGGAIYGRVKKLKNVTVV
jgi:hypothetical protein